MEALKTMEIISVAKDLCVAAIPVIQPKNSKELVELFRKMVAVVADRSDSVRKNKMFQTQDVDGK